MKLSLGNEWAQALENAKRDAVPPVPDGWITMKQFRGSDKTRDIAQIEMRLLISTGRVESRKFKVRDGDTLRSIPHYRLLKKK